MAHALWITIHEILEAVLWEKTTDDPIAESLLRKLFSVGDVWWRLSIAEAVHLW